MIYSLQSSDASCILQPLYNIHGISSYSYFEQEQIQTERIRSRTAESEITLIMINRLFSPPPPPPPPLPQFINRGLRRKELATELIMIYGWMVARPFV